MSFIDYSQYSLWHFCPWAWYEKYVRQVGKVWTGQRDDDLALGSLVHNGLENYVRHGRPEIDDRTIAEVTPTPECVGTARLLLEGYVTKYPKEVWPVEETEEPVKFPLGPQDLYGLAKFDGYFYVPEDTTVESGIPGYTIRLGRGWWSREYKTKSPHVDRAKWIQEWTTKMQADFQLLALRELVGEYPRGVLVCVLEKPKKYTPRRKCKGCGETWDLAAYFPTGEGGIYACPGCATHQKVSPYEPKVPRTTEFYRITAERTPERLDAAHRRIVDVALAMECVRHEGLAAIIPNMDNCVNNKWHRVCEYYDPHTQGREAEPGVGQFVQIDAMRYVGLQEAA